MIFTYPFFVALAVVLTVGSVLIDLKSAGLIELSRRLVPICVGGWVGAKLAFVVALALAPLPADQLAKVQAHAHLTDWPFWVGGGAVFYGGWVGAAVGWMFSGPKLRWPLATLGLKYLLIGQAIGRVGCFVQGCCYGRALFEHSLWLWPVALMEAVWMVGLFLWGQRRAREGGSAILWWDLYFFGQMGGRFGLEFLRGDLVRGMVGAVSFSQLLIILFVCLYVIMRKSIRSKVVANEWKNLYAEWR